MKKTNPIEESQKLRSDVNFLKKKIKKVTKQKDSIIRKLEKENTELKKNLENF